MNVEVKDEAKSNVIINAEVSTSEFTVYSDGDIVFLRELDGLSPDGKVSIKADMFMLIVCQRGSAQFDANSKRYTLSPGNAFLYIPRLVLSACVFSPDFAAYTLCISSRIMARFIGESKLWEKAVKISQNPIIRVNEINSKIFAAYGEIIEHRLSDKERPYKREVMASLTAAAVYELIAEVELQHGEAKQMQPTSGERLFQRFVVLISEQEVKPRSVSWYADKLCVTTKYLSSVCKAISDKTARDIICLYVMADIERLLKYSTLTTKEISAKLDFPNISFFGKYVKAHLGVSPNEYRTRAQRGEL